MVQRFDLILRYISDHHNAVEEVSYRAMRRDGIEA